MIPLVQKGDEVMSIGTTIARARKEKGITQEQLAWDLGVSREAQSKYETGARRFPEDLRSKVVQKLDDPDLYIEMAVEATGGVAIPILNGDYIDRHRAAMKDLVQYETNEALEKLAQTSLIKPVQFATEQDKEEMKRVIKELLDAVCSMINMIAVLCREYGFSMKEIYRSWFVTLKARRMRK